MDYNSYLYIPKRSMMDRKLQSSDIYKSKFESEYDKRRREENERIIEEIKIKNLDDYGV